MSQSIDWRGYYDREGETKTFHPDLDPAELMRVDFVRRMTSTLSFESALDAGCGNGFLASQYTAWGARRVAGIDFSRPRLLDGSSRYPHIQFSRASATQLPFADNAFDLVSLVEVLEHLPEPGQALAELGRVASKYVVVSVPYRGKLLEITCPHCLKDFHFDGHIHSFDEDKLSALAEAAGLRVVSVGPYLPYYRARGGLGKLPGLHRMLRKVAVAAKLRQPPVAKYLGLVASPR